METRRDVALRAKWKWDLTRRLYERGYGKQDIWELFRLIDWLMVLPAGLEVAFREELFKYEREKVMPFVTSIERLGRQEGLREALRANIVDVLEARFGKVPDSVRERIEALQEESSLKVLLRRAATEPSVAAFGQSF